MQDYLATIQSIDDSVGPAAGRAGPGRPGAQHHRDLHQRPGVLPRRPRAVRQALHVRGGAADAVPGPVAGGDQAGHAERRDRAQRRLRADLPGRGGAPGPARHAGAEPAARSCAASAPADWRTSMYYRYYHDPGDHNTRAHYGVRTRTHKLIYFWKKDQWELFDLVTDPLELHNLYGQPGHEQVTEALKAETPAAEEVTRRHRPVRRRATAERRGRPGGEAAREVAHLLGRSARRPVAWVRSIRVTRCTTRPQSRGRVDRNRPGAPASHSHCADRCQVVRKPTRIDLTPAA